VTFREISWIVPLLVAKKPRCEKNCTSASILNWIWEEDIYGHKNAGRIGDSQALRNQKRTSDAHRARVVLY
jgi:hypothetical protein